MQEDWDWGDIQAYVSLWLMRLLRNVIDVTVTEVTPLQRSEMICPAAILANFN